MGVVKTLRLLVKEIPAGRVALSKCEAIVANLQRKMCGVSSKDIKQECLKMQKQYNDTKHAMENASRQTGGSANPQGLNFNHLIEEKKISKNATSGGLTESKGATPTSGSMLGSVMNRGVNNINIGHPYN